MFSSIDTKKSHRFNLKHFFVQAFFLAVAFSFPNLAFSKEKLVFIVNTTENDWRGGAIPGAPYLIENDFIKIFQEIYPDAKIVKIRETTTEGVTRSLKMWMSPDPNQKEVVGLLVHSHGDPMRVMSEDYKFYVNLYEDIPKAFEPIIGKFGNNARIIFSGCSVLSGLTDLEAANALRFMAHRFGAKHGLIYANSTLRGMPSQFFLNIDLMNADISIIARATALLMSAMWPLSIPMFTLQELIFNKGIAFVMTEESRVHYKTNMVTTFAPVIQRDKQQLLDSLSP